MYITADNDRPYEALFSSTMTVKCCKQSIHRGRVDWYQAYNFVL